ISVQRIIVQRGIYEAFRNELVAYIREKIAAGDPLLPATIVGPMINARARDKVVDWIQDAELAGAKLLTPLKVEGASLLHPILIENAPDNAAVSCEEAFAPLAVLQPYDSFEEALGIVNDSAFGLQVGVFTPNITRAFQAYETLDVGGVMINQVPTFRVENMPYGGVKDSGFGREGIRYAMEEMTEPRSLVVNLG
ncbi:MAG: aldehyde dehydrogenase family protein, partial [Cupriavidus sp.]